MAKSVVSRMRFSKKTKAFLVFLVFFYVAITINFYPSNRPVEEIEAIANRKKRASAHIRNENSGWSHTLGGILFAGVAIYTFIGFIRCKNEDEE